MTDLRDQALDGKRAGKSVEETGAAMATALKAKYPDYNINANNATNVAKTVWSEN